MQRGFGIVTVNLNGRRKTVLSPTEAAHLLSSRDWPARDGPAFQEARRIVAGAVSGHCTHKAASEAFQAALREAGIEIIETEPPAARDLTIGEDARG